MPDTTICDFKTHSWAVERSIESISSSIAANCSSGIKFQFGNDNVYSRVFAWQLKLIFFQKSVLYQTSIFSTFPSFMSFSRARFVFAIEIPLFVLSVNCVEMYWINNHGSHFLGLTKFPNFAIIFFYFSIIFLVFGFFNWKLYPIWQIIHSSFIYHLKNK